MQVKLVNILTYVPVLSYERRHYPIIPNGMQYSIKASGNFGHQCESFHWFIIYCVLNILLW